MSPPSSRGRQIAPRRPATHNRSCPCRRACDRGGRIFLCRPATRACVPRSGKHGHLGAVVIEQACRRIPLTCLDVGADGLATARHSRHRGSTSSRCAPRSKHTSAPERWTARPDAGAADTSRCPPESNDPRTSRCGSPSTAAARKSRPGTCSSARSTRNRSAATDNSDETGSASRCARPRYTASATRPPERLGGTALSVAVTPGRGDLELGVSGTRGLPVSRMGRSIRRDRPPPAARPRRQCRARKG